MIQKEPIVINISAEIFTTRQESLLLFW